MLKKLAILIGMLALAAGTAFAQKVVTLDIDQVLTAFSKTAAIKAEVEADQKDAESLLKIKVDEFQKQREKLTAAQQKLEADRGNPTLSKAAVAKAEEEVKKTLEEAVKMEQDLRRSQQEMRELLQSKFTQKTNVVLQEDIFPRIKEIAKAHGKTAAQVVLRWNLQRNVSVIPGSSNPAHIKENTEIFDFELSDSDMKAIAALDRHEKHEWY